MLFTGDFVSSNANRDRPARGLPLKILRQWYMVQQHHKRNATDRISDQRAARDRGSARSVKKS